MPSRRIQICGRRAADTPFRTASSRRLGLAGRGKPSRHRLLPPATCRRQWQAAPRSRPTRAETSGRARSAHEPGPPPTSTTPTRGSAHPARIPPTWWPPSPVTRCVCSWRSSPARHRGARRPTRPRPAWPPPLRGVRHAGSKDASSTTWLSATWAPRATHAAIETDGLGCPHRSPKRTARTSPPVSTCVPDAHPRIDHATTTGWAGPRRADHPRLQTRALPPRHQPGRPPRGRHPA